MLTHASPRSNFGLRARLEVEREDLNVVLFIECGPAADTWISRVLPLSSNTLSKEGPLRTSWSRTLDNANDRFVPVMTAEALYDVSRINDMHYTRGWLICVRLCPANKITDRELDRGTGR